MLVSVQWDFHRTARELVTAQAQQSSNKNVNTNTNTNSASRESSNDDESYSSLIELNHWVVEHRHSSFSNHDNGRYGSGGEGDSEVCLLHPPVLMPSRKMTMNNSPPGIEVGAEANEELADEFNIDDMIEDDSSATNNNGSCEHQAELEYTEWTISIVFHQTWRVPTLYFTCAQTDGTPLDRQQVLDILLQHENNQNHNTSCSQEWDGWKWKEEELWEFVSQEEHPMTGKPSYFLHPCRTSERIESMMEMFMLRRQNQNNGNADKEDGYGQQTDTDNGNGNGDSFCPLLSWMSMILPVVGCKISPDVFCRMSKAMARSKIGNDV